MIVSLMTPVKAQKTLAANLRERRLRLNLTQEGLAERSGVPLATVRKFEQQGVISLESWLKLLMVLDGLGAVVAATEPPQDTFSSIDEVIELNTAPVRKRGRRR